MSTARANVALVATSLLATPLLAAERPWIEVRSPHFVVISNAAEKAARKVAWQFEQVHSLVPRLWPWARVSLARPTVVLATRDEASMKALLPEFWERKDAIHPAAILVTGRDRHYLAVRADIGDTSDETRENPYRMAYWTYVMLVLEQSFEQPLPLWFARGIAEVFANTMVRGQDIELGRVIPWQLQRLRDGESLSFQRVRTVDRESPYYKQRDKLECFDAHAWAAIHFLMFEDEGAYRVQLNRYSTLLQRGTKPDVALAEAFPALPTIEKRLDTYVQSLAFGFLRIKIDLDVREAGFVIRPLPLAEAAAIRAAFHVATGRPAEARALIEAGRKADPAWPALFEAEGLLADSEDRRDDAKAVYAKASEQPGAGYYALYRHAQTLHTGSPDEDTLVRIEASLRRSVEKNPGYANAHSYLADVLVSRGKAAEAEPLARKAISLDPTATYHHVALARVLAALDRNDEASREGEKGLSLATDSEEQERARSFLERLRASKQASAERTAAAATNAANEALVEACRGGDAAACGKAAPLFERACGEDDARACASLGWFHEQGRGIPRDLERAASLYTMACDLGEKRACLARAVLQADGRGLPRNEAEARGAADKLCSDGLNEACTFLATMHLRTGTAKDLARARALLTQACSGKDEQACSMLKSLPAR
jgi:TPR repeat protein